MTHKQIRQQFREMSGRYELVDEAGGDRGADFYINAGQRFLDGLETVKKAEARVFRLLAANHYGVQFQYSRAIKEVWAASVGTSGMSRWQLTKMDIQELRAIYASLPSDIDSGDPLYYTPAVLRLAPGTPLTEIQSLEGFLGYADVSINRQQEYNGVIVMPPPSVQTMIEVWGLFYSEPLVADEDESYWSTVHPELLLMASMRTLEEFYRNSQGVNDWTNAIKQRIVLLGMDTVEEDISECNQMKG